MFEATSFESQEAIVKGETIGSTLITGSLPRLISILEVRRLHFTRIMLQHNQNCWKSHRGKLIICFLIAVVIIQYFSASVYSIKIFDYRVMQSFYFNDGGGKKGNGASSNSELIVEEHPVPENTTEMLPKNEEENAAMKSEENNEPAKIIVAQEVSAGVKAETESTVADDKTNLSSVPQNFSSSQLPICPVVPPVLGKIKRIIVLKLFQDS